MLPVRHQRPRRRRQRPVLRARPVGSGDPPVRHDRGAGAGRDRPRAGAPPARPRHAHLGPAAQELPRQQGALSDLRRGRRPSWPTSIRSGPLEKPQRARRRTSPSRSSPWPPNDRGDVPGGRRGPPGTASAGAVRADLARLSRLVPARRRGGAAVLSSSAAACCASICPSLLPTWERLVDLVGGGDLEARFLSLYDPPAFVSGCTQALWTHRTPALVRNYDYAPQPVRRTDPAQRAATAPPRARDERLRLGCARRRQRARARRVAGLWRPPPGRQRLRDHGGAALHPGVLLGGRRRRWRSCAACRSMSATIWRCSIATGGHATVFVAPDRPARVEPWLVSANRQARGRQARRAERPGFGPARGRGAGAAVGSGDRAGASWWRRSWPSRSGATRHAMVGARSTRPATCRAEGARAAALARRRVAAGARAVRGRPADRRVSAAPAAAMRARSDCNRRDQRARKLAIGADPRHGAARTGWVRRRSTRARGAGRTGSVSTWRTQR